MGRQRRTAPPSAGALQGPVRGTHKNKGRGTPAPARPRRLPVEDKTGVEAAAARPAGSAAPRLAAAEEGGGPGLAGTDMPRRPQAPKGARRIAGLSSPQLSAPRPAPGAAGELGIQTPEAWLAQRRRWSSRGGSSGLPPSSRARDEACLLWASCGKEGCQMPLPALPDCRPPAPRDPPPPSRPRPSAISPRPLLSASQPFWQLGGTTRV